MTRHSARAENIGPMSKAIILQQVAYEGPGRLIPVFRDYGIPTEVRRLYQGDEVPTDLESIRALIVLGGPMGVSDVGNDKYPFLAKELDLLKRMVAADRPVLGICLGAQLLAAAGGAKVYPNAKPGATPDAPTTPVPELGWAPVKFPFPGGTDPLVTGMHDGAQMFHWHFDTFDLPKLPSPPPAPGTPPPPTGNAWLAASAACRHQAFRFKNRLVGYQFHFEFTQAEIEAVVGNASPEVKAALGEQGLATIAQQSTLYYRDFERLGNRLARNYVQFMGLC